jgi:predicted DNA-binding protein YlxM (UPF0122 family)
MHVCILLDGVHFIIPAISFGLIVSETAGKKIYPSVKRHLIIMSGVVYTCDFPKQPVHEAVEKCEELLCQKQKKLSLIRQQAVQLEGISVKDKAIREGWSAAQDTCSAAIAAIQQAVSKYTNEHERNSIVLKVAELLDPGHGGDSTHLTNCRRLIQNTDNALNALVMDYWKRKCSEKIHSNMKDNTSEAQRMQNEMQKEARAISKHNAAFESAVDQITTSASVASRHVVTIDWLASVGNKRSIPSALDSVLKRGDTEPDNIYYKMFVKAWDDLQCPPGSGGNLDDDVVTIPASKSWFEKVVESINRSAQMQSNATSLDPCQFHFGSKDNRVVVKENDLKLKIELGGNAKQQIISIQVCPSRG